MNQLIVYTKRLLRNGFVNFRMIKVRNFWLVVTMDIKHWKLVISIHKCKGNVQKNGQGFRNLESYLFIRKRNVFICWLYGIFHDTYYFVFTSSDHRDYIYFKIFKKKKHYSGNHLFSLYHFLWILYTKKFCELHGYFKRTRRVW